MGQIIAKHTDASGREERIVSIRHEDGSLVVREETKGELTQQVYGTRAHVQMVSLSESAARLAGFADNMAAIGRFFTTDDAYLSDLMDALDAWGVPYRYLSTDCDRSGGAVMRGA